MLIKEYLTSNSIKFQDLGDGVAVDLGLLSPSQISELTKFLESNKDNTTTSGYVSKNNAGITLGIEDKNQI